MSPPEMRNMLVVDVVLFLAKAISEPRHVISNNVAF